LKYDEEKYIATQVLQRLGWPRCSFLATIKPEHGFERSTGGLSTVLRAKGATQNRKKASNIHLPLNKGHQNWYMMYLSLQTVKQGEKASLCSRNTAIDGRDGYSGTISTKKRLYLIKECQKSGVCIRDTGGAQHLQRLSCTGCSFSAIRTVSSVSESPSEGVTMTQRGGCGTQNRKKAFWIDLHPLDWLQGQI
jgi:hypothetical protein